MLPFMGYNAGDYMKHWLDVGAATDEGNRPKLFWVNWFRKGEDGSFLWPGFGENSRVLKWVFERLEGTADAVDTAIGRVPAAGSLDTTGLDIDEATLTELLKVDNDAWRGEIPLIEGHFESIGERLPDELRDELRELEKRLAD
jgi:phosphoenolpyruvate carboxykinase (GTP)